MHSQSRPLGGLQIAVVFGSLLAALALVASPAAAATPDETLDQVTFIGDSVTAGFGYCGTAENAKNISCKANQEINDRWYFGDNSLDDCAPPDPPKKPTNACSNNNFNGQPWRQDPWTAGPNAPKIAYPFQIAASQGKGGAAVSDWAVTGSTPADWDPNGGDFGFLLDRLKNQYVGMTLGANPLLSYYTNIEFTFKTVKGRCVSSTGNWERKSFITSGRWYAGQIDDAVACLKREWARLDQTDHLVDIYTSLLSRDNRVVVLGYYRSCSWSFGNWQPHANASGPAAGNDCKTQRRQVSRNNSNVVTQWDQAVAVGRALNDLIQDAVGKAQDRAAQRWPGTGRDQNLVFTVPDADRWEQHQATSPNGSWVLLNDTWIHPNRDGAGNLAETVTKAMCKRFDRWCGSPIRWKG